MEKAIRQPVGVSVCIGSLLYAGVHGKVRFYDLKLDEILQKDPGFGGVIPRFLGKYLSTDDFSCVIIFQ